MVADDPFARSIQDELRKISQDLADHRVSSLRRHEEITEKVSFIDHNQRSNANKLQELAKACEQAVNKANRAVEVAGNAQRIVSEVVIEAKEVYSSMVRHNDGIGSRFTAQDKQLAKIENETQKQTTTLAEQRAVLALLVEADTERKLVEDAREIREKATQDLIKKNNENTDRTIKNGAALFAMIAGVVGALMWMLVHFLK